MSGFYEFLIATDMNGNTAGIHGRRRYALYQTHIIRLHKITVSCSCYKSWDTLIFLANCMVSAFTICDGQQVYVESAMMQSLF